MSLQDVRTLVVDDNATNRTILRQYLQSWGCPTAEAASAQEAVQALREAYSGGQPFRLALIDTQMPEADGATAGRWIKTDPQIRDTILVSLSSAPLLGEAARLREIGYAEYLHKPIRQSHLYNTLVELLQPPPAPASPGPRPPAPGSRSSPPRLLLAEDNEVNRTIALRLLQRAGYRADAVSNGRQAVEAACHNNYDLVLMDIQMPEMDGFEATAEIQRRLGPAVCPPIVAMTANTLHGDRDRCLVAGMSDYVSKPIRLEDLIRTLHRWITTEPRP